MMPLEDAYCVKECTKWIQSNNYLKVGLEFPNEPQDAIKVSQSIKEKIRFSPIVLEDSNRACGNCCVDERTAKPRNIDCIIHFGRTCLTQTLALPVLYVLSPSITINPEVVGATLCSEKGPKKEEDLILFYDVLCLPSIDEVFIYLKSLLPSLILSTFIIPEGSTLIPPESNLVNDLANKLKLNEENGTILTFNSRQVLLPKNKSISDYNVIYLGPTNSSLVSLQMYLSDKTFYHVNPSDQILSVSNFLKVVMGRSRKIEQVKEAKTIGILNTLVRGHQLIACKLRKLIQTSNRRCYSFFMGKINEPKLANIVGVDVFVYIGCPESSLFDRVENTYLYKNIVTPWELEVALNPSASWSLNFETDFREFLKDKYSQEFSSEDDTNEVSTVSEEREDRSNTAVVPRDPGTLFKLHENAAGEVLQGLDWKGLDPKAESSIPLGTVVEGRKGIAVAYESEEKN